MINLLRKNQRGLMLVIAVLTIVAFILLYNTAQLRDLASQRNPQIYGQTLTPGAIDRQVKNYQLTLALGQYDLVSKLGGSGEDQSAALTDFVWNLLVLQHQARVLGVQPTDDEVAARIKALPVFQIQGQFDPLKYGAFVSEQLTPRGFTERQLEEVMRDSLRLEKISAIVESPAAVGDLELRDAARILQPVSGYFIRFNTETVAPAVKVDPSEVAAYFERNQANLNTRETRGIRYVAFTLPAGSTIDGHEKVEALQKLADAATRFADSLGASSLEQAASSAGLTVGTMPSFDREGNFSDGQAAGADKALASALAPSAFLLSGPGKASDVIQAGDGFYIIELTGLNAARPLTLAEASPAIEARLRQAKADEILNNSSVQKLQQLRAAVGSGTPFADAAKAAGLEAEAFDNLSPTSEALTPEQRRMVVPTLSMKDGEISGFERAPWGGFSVYLKSRGPLADADLDAKRAEIRDGLLENKRGLLFAEWLRVCREEAKISMPGRPRS